MTGVGLTRIDGIDSNSALKIIAEIGTDMSRWKSAKHFASWLGLCPGTKISGGKVLSSKTKSVANRAAMMFRMAAFTLFRSKSALGACLRRQRSHLGAPKAITTTAHKLAGLVYAMFKYGTDYVDAGQEYYEEPQLSELDFQDTLSGCSGLAHSGIDRRTNHHDGDLRRAPRSCTRCAARMSESHAGTAFK